MEGGKLREKVEIQSRASAQDGMGGPVDDSATVMTRRASVKALSGRELLQAQQVQADVTYEVTMRFCETLTPQMRIRWLGKTLHVESVIHSRAMVRMTVALCKEVI